MCGGIDVNKNYESRRCIICNYYHFLITNFRFQPKVCDGYHDLMQRTMSFNDVEIVSVKRNDYKIHFWYMGKDVAISIMNNVI